MSLSSVPPSAFAHHLSELGGLLKVSFSNAVATIPPVSRAAQSQVASQRVGAASVVSQLALSDDGAELLQQQPDLFVRVVAFILAVRLGMFMWRCCRFHCLWILCALATKRRAAMRLRRSQHAWCVQQHSPPIFSCTHLVLCNVRSFRLSPTNSPCRTCAATKLPRPCSPASKRFTALAR